MRLQEFSPRRAQRSELFSLWTQRDSVLSVASVVSIRQNKSPIAIALGDWFSLRTYVLTSKASPNDSEIVIIVIIIVIGEAHQIVHIGGIIAQFCDIYQF